MTDVAQALQWGTNPGGPFSLDGFPAAADWTTTLTGGPGPPLRVGLTGFSNDGTLAFGVDPSSLATPNFLGLHIISLVGSSTSSQVGVAICSGPVPAGTPGMGPLTLNESDLTVLQAWLLADTDSLETWVPLTVGVYYYLAVECWDPFGFGMENCQLEDNFAGSASFHGGAFPDVHTSYAGGEEDIFPVGASFDLQTTVLAAQTATLDIDWGDGNTESHFYDIPTYLTAEGDTSQGRSWSRNIFLPTGSTAYPHTYDAVGLYTVVLTVTDGNGGVATVNKPVAAIGPPTATITATPMRVRLGFGTLVTVSDVHSDAWDLMHLRDPADNPDNYDPTITAIGHGGPAHTSWAVLAVFTTDFADWSGPGLPFDAIDVFSSAPLPIYPHYPVNAHNLAIVAAHGTTPIDFIFGDYPSRWDNELRITLHIALLPAEGPYQRSYPRDDGRGASTLRSYPPPVDSPARSYPRIS